MYIIELGEMMNLVLLCLKVFLVRILDVSLGTIRTVLTVKDKIVKASLIGFFEVLVWFLVVKDALNSDINSLWVAVSYAGGFASGTYIGGLLARLFNRKETLGIQIIIKKGQEELIHHLRLAGFAVVVMVARGLKDEERMLLFTEISVLRFNDLKRIVKEYDHTIFMVVNDTRTVYNGYFNSLTK